MDRLDAMRVFLAVADRGSFAEAARRLRLSPAAVTRAVAQLEARLGVGLLSRTTRSVTLTEQGARYLGKCRELLEALDESERTVRREAAEPRGRLAVTAPFVFGRLHILPIVETLLDRHPALSIRLELSDRITHLQEDAFDIAVRIGPLPSSALIAIRVAQVQRVLVASPAYLARHPPLKSAACLTDHELIAFEQIDTGRDWRFAGPGGEIVRVAPRLSVTSADAAIDAAIRGRGVTRTLSYQASAGLASGALALVLQELAPPPVPVSLVYPPSRRGLASISAFIETARRYFAAHAESLLP